jgi:multidrug efflux pump
VFFGMIGVTFFGIFLPPGFYTAIRYLTDRHPAHAETPLRSVPSYTASEERRAAGGAHR